MLPPNYYKLNHVTSEICQQLIIVCHMKMGSLVIGTTLTGL